MDAYIVVKMSMRKNTAKKQDNKYFRTSSFYAAAFLYAKGLELVDVDRTADPKRAAFVFTDKKERELLLENYNFGKEDSSGTLVDARKYATAIKMLKEKLYQDRF